MKQNKIYIIATICFLVGISVVLIGFSLIHFDVTRLDTKGKYEQKNFVSSEPIHDIEVNDKNIGVTLSASIDDKVHISYFENEKDYYAITQSKGGKLHIQKKDVRKWYDHFFVMNFQTIKLSVAIPKNYSGEMSIHTSNGHIDVSNLQANTMKLETSNSKITTDHVVVSEKLEAVTSNASISLTKTKTKGDVLCETNNGKISLDQVQCESLQAKSANGRIDLKSVVTSNNITAQTSNSRISFQKIAFGTKLDCQTSNGAVEGTMKGKLTDYSIRSKTSNGRNNLPEHQEGGEKEIVIKTSNSGIEVGFGG